MSSTPPAGKVAEEADLRRLADDFAQLRDQMEADFVAAGDRLIRACEQFQGLEAAMNRIAGLTEFHTIPRIVSAVQAFDRKVREQIGDIVQAIQPLLDLSARTQRVKTDILDLSRVVRTMGIVALNARVIVAGNDAGGRDLTGFTSDAELLISGAADNLRRMVTAIERLLSSSQQTRVAADEFNETLDTTVSSRLQDLTQELQVTEDWLGRTVSSSGALSLRAARVRSDMAATVMSLQSGDATRQRLDHIAVILIAAADAVKPGLRLALVDLARRQVDSASTEHLRNLRDACAALDRTGRGTLALLSDLDAAFAGRTRGVGPLNAAMAGLRDALSHCRARQTEFGGQTDTLRAAYRQIIDLADGLRGLDGKMHLVGMNAVIACANLGSQGLPLKETALQLQTLAASARALHEALGQSLSRMEDVSTRSQTALGTEGETLADLLGAEQASIAGLLDLVGAPLDEMRFLLDSRRTDLQSGTHLATEILGRHGRTFSALIDRVRSIAPDAARGVADIGADLVVESLREILTMQQERDVHDDWLAGHLLTRSDGCHRPVAEASNAASFL